MKKKHFAFRKAFSDEIYQRRKQMELTQQTVADAVQISLRWYQMLESGLYMPGAIVMIRLMIYMNINPQMFAKEVKIDAIDTFSHS